VKLLRTAIIVVKVLINDLLALLILGLNFKKQMWEKQQFTQKGDWDLQIKYLLRYTISNFNFEPAVKKSAQKNIFHSKLSLVTTLMPWQGRFCI